MWKGLHGSTCNRKAGICKALAIAGCPKYEESAAIYKFTVDILYTYIYTGF